MRDSVAPGMLIEDRTRPWCFLAALAAKELALVAAATPTRIHTSRPHRITRLGSRCVIGPYDWGSVQGDLAGVSPEPQHLRAPRLRQSGRSVELPGGRVRPCCLRGDRLAGGHRTRLNPVEASASAADEVMTLKLCPSCALDLTHCNGKYRCTRCHRGSRRASVWKQPACGVTLSRLCHLSTRNFGRSEYHSDHAHDCEVAGNLRTARAAQVGIPFRLTPAPPTVPSS